MKAGPWGRGRLSQDGFLAKDAFERGDEGSFDMLDQVFFGLDATRFRKFNALLDAPPAPNAGLERLMAVKAPWSADAA